MSKLKRRIVSMLLIAAMVIPVNGLPKIEAKGDESVTTAAVSAGEEKKDTLTNKLGFTTTKEAFDKSDTINPYTKSADDTATLFKADELMLTSLNNDSTIYDMNKGTSKYFTGKTSDVVCQDAQTLATTLSNTKLKLGNHDYMKTFAFDPTGSGQKDHIYVQIADLNVINGVNVLTSGYQIFNGKTGELILEEGDYMTHVLTEYTTIESHQIGSLMNATIGDFDGDGCDEVASYIAVCADYVPVKGKEGDIGPEVRISKYVYLGNDIYHMQNQTSILLNSPMDEGGFGLSANSSNLYAERIISVDLATSVQKNQKADDLVISVSYGRNTVTVASNAYTRVGVWKEPLIDLSKINMQYFNMKWDHHEYDSSVTAGKKYEIMMFGGVAAGDIDNDGSDEIVVSGYRIDSANMASWNLDENYFLQTYIEYDSSKETYTDQCNGSRILGQSIKMDNDDNNFSGKKLYIYSGFADGNNPTKNYQLFTEPMSVETFAEQGSGYAESIFAEGYVMKFTATSGAYMSPTVGKQEANANFGLKYTVLPSEVIKGSTSTISASNYRYISDVAVGNFDGNTFGMEQIACVYGYQKHKCDNCGYYAQVLMAGQNSPGERSYGYVNSNGTKKIENHVLYALPVFENQNSSNISICSVDLDDDAMLASFDNKSSYFTNPQIVAILEAAPYYEDLVGLDSSYGTESETAFGVSKGSGQSTTQEVSVSAGLVVGFEQTVSVLGIVDVYGIDIESTMTASMGYGYEHEVTKTKTTTYKNTGGTHQVIASITPYTRYVYNVTLPEVKIPTKAEYDAMVTQRDSLQKNWFSENSNVNKTSEEYYLKEIEYEQLKQDILSIDEDIAAGKSYGSTYSGKEKQMNVDIPEEPSTQMIDADTYDEVISTYGEGQYTKISEVLSSEPGVPTTYTDKWSDSRYSDPLVTDKKNIDYKTISHNAGNAAEEMNYTEDKSTSHEITWGAGIDSSIVVSQGGAKIGVTMGIDYSGGYSWISTSGYSYSGVVENLPTVSSTMANYGFKVAFDRFYATVKDASSTKGKPCLVLGYSVKDANVYPQKPIDFTVEQYGDASAILKWDTQSQKSELQADSYDIYGKTNNGEYAKLTTTTNKMAVIDGLSALDIYNNPINYSFKVVAKKTLNNITYQSVTSDEASFYLPDDKIDFMINQQPQDQTTRSGGSVEFSLQAQTNNTVGTFSYQWQELKDNVWTDIAGALSNTYNRTAVTASAKLRCKVKLIKNSGFATVKYSKVVTASIGKTKPSMSFLTMANLNGTPYLANSGDEIAFSFELGDLVSGTTKQTPAGEIELYVDGVKLGATISLNEKAIGTAEGSLKKSDLADGIHSVYGVYVPATNSEFSTVTSETMLVNVNNKKEMQLVLNQNKPFVYGDKLNLSAYLIGTTKEELDLSDLSVKLYKDGTLVTDSNDYIFTDTSVQYKIDVSTTSGDSYSATTGNFSIQKAPLVIRTKDVTTYLSTAATVAFVSKLNSNYVVEGLVNSDTIGDDKVTLSADGYLGTKGNYTYKAALSADAIDTTHYDITYDYGILTLMDEPKVVFLSLANEMTYADGTTKTISPAAISGSGKDLVSASKVNYTYYLDKGCTKCTTTDEGAAVLGGAPSKAGEYYVLASVSGTVDYLSASSNVACFVIDAEANQVNVVNVENGTITTSVNSAQKGSAVVVKYQPNAGYTINERSVVLTGTTEPLNAIETNATDLRFVMPDGAVTVTGSFKQITPTGIVISDDVSRLNLYVGQTGKREASVVPAQVMNTAMLYESSDEEVATVNTQGLVTAIKEGSAKITIRSAMDNAITNSYYVDVVNKTEVLAIAMKETTKTMNINDEASLSVVFTPATASEKVLTWTSSNLDVVSVSRNGDITALAAGTAVITAVSVDSGKKTSCTVTVKQAVIPKVSYTISYYLNGGKAAANPTTYQTDTATFTLKNPTRKGYLFAGWYKESSYKTKVTQIAKGSSGNLLLYAKWTKVTVNKVTISKAKKIKTKMTVQLKKSSKVAGYQLQYAKKKNLQGKKAVLFKKLKVNIKSLTKKKKYYVRVRAYKLDSMNKKVYGKWSKVVLVKG